MQMNKFLIVQKVIPIWLIVLQWLWIIGTLNTGRQNALETLECFLLMLAEEVTSRVSTGMVFLFRGLELQEFSVLGSLQFFLNWRAK